MCVSLSETEEGERTTMTGQLVAKVKRTKLTACMTCPLCEELFTDATTISECLHTFCRECIYKKIINEYLKHCPVCNVDLGCTPLDKLRADHNLQDLRDKLFPNERKKVKAPYVMPSLPISIKRKERSLSSLGANTSKLSSRSSIFLRRPKVSAGNSLTPQDFTSTTVQPDKVADGKKNKKHSEVEHLDEIPTKSSARRRKAAPRKRIIRRDLVPSTSEPTKVAGLKKDEKHYELERLDEISKTKTQVKEDQLISSKPDLSHQNLSNQNSEENAAALCNEKTDMWDSLNCLVEAASDTKSSQSTMKETAVTPVPVNYCNNNSRAPDDVVKTKGLSTIEEDVVIPVPVDSSDNDSHAPEIEVQIHSHNQKAAGDQNELNSAQSDSTKPRRLRSNQPRRPKFSQDLNVPAQEVIDTSSESNKNFSPIWFSLVPSEKEEVNARLPQISSSYLRVKDGSLPVSFIKKYLMRKLNLASEAELEISLLGQPVLSSLQLQNLVDLWLETMPTPERIQTSVGSSAKDFVMVLSYGRKAQPF